MRILMRWLSSVPLEMRQRFLGALAERSDELEKVVFQMVGIVEDPHATPSQRHRSLATITDALFLNPHDGGQHDQDLAASETGSEAEFAGPGCDVQRTDCQVAAFADRLRELMTVTCVTQQELSNRVGCSQPAISQMLNRKSRPQKKTILRLTAALQVAPRELWPDLETADMLHAVADFQQDGHAMTEAEAKALRDTASRSLRNCCQRLDNSD
jgi:transcriptional regulator with XRE-family HTH domain